MAHIICIIPEQFTVKAHPALFEGNGPGRGRGEPKKVELLFQFTIHIHIQNVQTNCEGSHSVRFLIFKIAGKKNTNAGSTRRREGFTMLMYTRSRRSSERIYAWVPLIFSLSCT